MGSGEGWDVVDRASELARQGVEFALATVVWRQPPSSGQQGSRAIITADGRIEGWIGGACAEPVVVREAQRVIVSQEPQLMFLGTTDAPVAALPDGMIYVPMSCQSEGALQIYVEPVVPSLDLVVVGRSPMARMLADLASTLGWTVRTLDSAEFSAAVLDERSIVVVATQGHGDEETIEAAVAARPAFVGVVASHKRGRTLLTYLADRGIPQEHLDRVQTPVGLDLGHTSHQEIAVSVLADLVRRRAAGEFGATTTGLRPPLATEVVDPVCGMTVSADSSAHPLDHDGTTYYFCCRPCHDAFAADPGAYLSTDPADVEA